MPTYQMTPKQSETRMRADHNVFAAKLIENLSPLDVLTGSELWTALADGVEVKAGDKWLKVTHRNGVALPIPGWTAYIHKGAPICGNFKQLPDTPTDPETPAPQIFPESFILTDPKTGKRAEFVFVRVIE